MNASTVLRFLRWWGRELASLVPPPLRGGPVGGDDGLVLALEADEVVVAARRGGRERELGRVPRPARVGASASAAETAPPAALRRFDPASTTCWLVVPREEAVTRSFQLPLAAAQQLDANVRAELEHELPIPPGQVLHAYRIVKRDRAAGKMTVELDALRRARAEDAIGLLAGWELESARGETPRTNGNGERVAFRLRSPRFRERSGRRVNALLAIANLALLTAVLAIPILEQRARIVSLETRLETARRAAAEAVAVEARIDRIEREARFIAGRKTRHPAMVEVLEDLSARLPDSTWLIRLESRNGRLTLQGYSAAASALIATLDESPLLHDVSFASPVTRVGASGRERFDITGTLAERGSAGKGS